MDVSSAPLSFWAGVLHHQLYLTWKCFQDERVKNLSFVWAQLKIQLEKTFLSHLALYQHFSCALHFNVCKSCLLAHSDIFWSSSDDCEEKLKDRFMIYFAFHRFLSDIKLTEKYFCSACIYIAFLLRHFGVLIALFTNLFFRWIFLPRVWKTIRKVRVRCIKIFITLCRKNLWIVALVKWLFTPALKKQ